MLGSQRRYPTCVSNRAPRYGAYDAKRFGASLRDLQETTKQVVVLLGTRDGHRR
jgi:hypothetical protein